MKAFLLTLISLFMFNAAAAGTAEATGKEAIIKYLADNFSTPVDFYGRDEESEHYRTYLFEEGLLKMGGEMISDGMAASLYQDSMITEEGLILPLNSRDEVPVVIQPSSCAVKADAIECDITYEDRFSEGMMKIKTAYTLSPRALKETTSYELYMIKNGELVLESQGSSSFEIQADRP